LLALASLDLACRVLCPGVSATLTATAFDHSSSRWLGISDLIAEPEGPSFISRTVTHRRLDRRYSWHTTHRESYGEMVMVVVVGVIIALGAGIALGTVFGSF
jgi:hypothetical protein